MDDVKGCHTDLGIYGFDMPESLLEHTLDHIKENHHDLNAIILNGDFVGHGVALSSKTD